MKYNVGDKVIIRPDLKTGHKYGEFSTDSGHKMCKWRGKVMTIRTICGGHSDRYSMVEDQGEKGSFADNNGWFWNDEMIMPVINTIYTKFHVNETVMINNNIEVGDVYGDIIITPIMTYKRGCYYNVDKIAINCNCDKVYYLLNGWNTVFPEEILIGMSKQKRFNLRQ
jgi:hypothetical protein